MLTDNYMDINLDNTSYNIDDDLIKIITELTNANPPYYGMQFAVTINFRDQNYSAEQGGYHPVEIRLIKKKNGWFFDYITDFGYVGPIYPELEKVIDFGIEDKYTWVAVYGDIPMVEGMELFELWQANFINYWMMNVYSVTVEWE